MKISGISLAFVAVMGHLVFSVRDLHLADSHVRFAFAIGIVVGILIASFGAALKQPLLGTIVGVSFCYLFAIGYFVLWVGIPIEWIY